MIRVLGSETDTVTIVQQQPSTFGLLLWDFQPLPTPDALHPLGVDMPALPSEQGGDVPITVAAILAGQVHDRLRQDILILSHHQGSALS